MKKIAIKIALLTFSIAILAVAPAFSQAYGYYRAHIPFDFVVGGTNMAAGDYKLGIQDSGLATGPLILRATRGKGFKVLSIARRGPDTGVNKGKMIFTKTGDEYALSGIDTPFYNWKSRWTVTVAHKDITSANRPTPESVEVNIVAVN
jgi:hypothetical protein